MHQSLFIGLIIHLLNGRRIVWLDVCIELVKLGGVDCWCALATPQLLPMGLIVLHGATRGRYCVHSPCVCLHAYVVADGRYTNRLSDLRARHITLVAPHHVNGVSRAVWNSVSG
ncbi:hypothetical protein F5B20DRAFT_110792 [Whalleya microplaca]|nr:hypothetical protein F5B20DRAFT_110792 [Whalleya microplaca]